MDGSPARSKAGTASRPEGVRRGSPAPCGQGFFHHHQEPVQHLLERPFIAVFYRNALFIFPRKRIQEFRRKIPFARRKNRTYPGIPPDAEQVLRQRRTKGCPRVAQSNFSPEGHKSWRCQLYVGDAHSIACGRIRAFALLRFGKRKLCALAENVQANGGQSPKGGLCAALPKKGGSGSLWAAAALAFPGLAGGGAGECGSAGGEPGRKAAPSWGKSCTSAFLVV